MQADIIAVPAFRDNYIWLIVESGSRNTWIVDPGDAGPVLERLREEELTPVGILLTHHHPDHTGGVDELLSHYPVPVYGPVSERIPQITDALGDGDRITVAGREAQVIEVPGHTLDHIAYFLPEQDQAAPLLFCGDTLFAGGCGRLFEGTPAQMYRSLQRLAALPGDTRVYCAHEYTRANLQFAAAAEPDNEALRERLETVGRQRDAEQITIPSSIEVELRTNPFLRCHSSGIVRQLQAHDRNGLEDETAVFAALRQWKDNF